MRTIKKIMASIQRNILAPAFWQFMTAMKSQHGRIINSAGKATENFSTVTSANVPRSVFNRNSTLLTTFDAGYLVPLLCDEVLPGDTMQMTTAHVARTITPLVPVMDNLELEFFAFFVPNRLVWDNWEKLMGENKDTAWTPSSTPHGVPRALLTGTQTENKIGDYYGIPRSLDYSTHFVSSLPFRGYIKIWNEWFRNQNIQAPVDVETDDTDQISATKSPNSALFEVNRPFDYFSACLPEPQKGDSSLIPINISELIPVGTETTASQSGAHQQLQFLTTTGGTPGNVGIKTAGSNGSAYSTTESLTAGSDMLYPSNLWADPTGLGDIGQSTISELRTAFQIQRLYERDARGGTRYVEMLKAHFGVNSGDYRLQRPEFLGHYRSTINSTQVAQTSATGLTGGSTEAGSLTAYAHDAGTGFLFNKSFVEHGYLHVFAVARHKKTYSQGLERYWSREDRFDFYHPVLAHISEQPVYSKELYYGAATDTVFGYNEAWSDLRYKPSKTTALMNVDNSQTLSIWHYGEDYASTPTLNDAWMQDSSYTQLDRTLAVTSNDCDQIYLNILFKNKCTRPMPLKSIPGLIDHF